MEDVVNIVSNAPEQSKEDIETTCSCHISYTNALKAVETLLEYVHRQEEGSAVNIIWLRLWRKTIAKKRWKKNKKLSGFYVKKLTAFHLITLD